MLENIGGTKIILKDSELLRRQNRNREYMMSLKSENLLLNYNLEAGRYTAPFHPNGIHGGWEAQTCQLRGHFLGHWLSAAAMHFVSTGDQEIKAKADVIVHELALCQEENGGKWVGSIPEKYLDWIAKGKEVWAPQYTLHKTLMGLADMYELTANQEALLVVSRFADWFLEWSAGFSRQQFDDILDVETGGILEVWVQLYQLTKESKYKILMERYYRARLFDTLLAGKDVLTNMHANTTIPEVLGCARAYEVTGEQKWRDIVEAYWRQAVTTRGQYATGGQTSGEIWTPKQELAARLGDKNQEHCVVYNMLRLADFLFRWTKDASYADYREMGIYNGLMAQAYWKHNGTNGIAYDKPQEGLLSYFLPLRAGAKKGWGSETQDFFCCHGTLVQANAAWEQGIFFQERRDVYLCQYFDVDATFEVEGETVRFLLNKDTLTGSFHLSSDSAGKQNIHENTAKYPRQPDCITQVVEIQTENEVEFTLHVRVPWWVKGAAKISINGKEEISVTEKTVFYPISRIWKKGDNIRITLPRGISTWPLPDKPNTQAFLYGPVLLAGLCENEPRLDAQGLSAEELLTHDNEREWGSWKETFQTVNQANNFRFIPLYDIGYEAYTVYFPIINEG
ncbi:beta-L-arabinofuranosidase domain-containing protein [Scatolibacter rhodanostii]|uniref:beta-L-arabinofuranosidase domain-containing protein n=1 Tax=Scatolibacter rhodanostii TaxID=2014781 RepID=UPI000C06C706|nr:beta-L-arabinofuranosidase domain-containing protein [Scatolibacter rhodanostii]